MKVLINGRLHTVQVLDRPAQHGDYVIEKSVLKTLDEDQKVILSNNLMITGIILTI